MEEKWDEGYAHTPSSGGNHDDEETLELVETNPQESAPKDLARSVLEEAVFKEFKSLMNSFARTPYPHQKDDFAKKLFVLAKDLPAEKILSVTEDKDKGTFFHILCHSYPEMALQILDKFSGNHFSVRLATTHKSSPLRLALLSMIDSKTRQHGFELAKQIIQHAHPGTLASIDGNGKNDLEHIRSLDIPHEYKAILQKLYIQQLELVDVDRDAVFKDFEKLMWFIGGNIKKVTHDTNNMDKLFALAQKLPSSKILSITTDSSWNYFHYICRYRPDQALQILDKLSPYQMAIPTAQVSAFGLALNGLTVDKADIFIALAKELIRRTQPQDLLKAKGNGETDFERLMSANIDKNCKVDLLGAFAQKFHPMEGELKQNYLDQAFQEYSKVFKSDPNFSHFYFPLIEQLSGEKILEPKFPDGRNFLHYLCDLHPDIALKLLDKFSPSQLYQRAPKGESPLYITLDWLEYSCKFQNGKESQYFELAKEIIRRADPKDLDGKDISPINDYVLIGTRDIPTEMKDELSRLYQERIGSHKLVPVTQVPQSVKINPHESIQALIARLDANELDALETIETLQDSFRATVDEVARISVSSSEKVKGAIGSMGALIVSISMVENSLQQLADNPERVVIRPGIAGIFDRTLRACLPGVYDPLRPALQHLQNARALARAADQESQEMLRVQIALAENQSRFKEPYAVTLESLETAVAHYKTQEDPQSQRMLRIFEGAARSMKQQVFQLDRLASNTDSGRECAITTIQFTRDMHDTLNALAVDISRLATQSTARELARIAVRGDVRDGDIGLRAVFKMLTDDMKARLETQRGTAIPLLASLESLNAVELVESDAKATPIENAMTAVREDELLTPVAAATPAPAQK